MNKRRSYLVYIVAILIVGIVVFLGVRATLNSGGTDNGASDHDQLQDGAKTQDGNSVQNLPQMFEEYLLTDFNPPQSTIDTEGTFFEVYPNVYFVPEPRYDRSYLPTDLLLSYVSDIDLPTSTAVLVRPAFTDQRSFETFMNAPTNLDFGSIARINNTQLLLEGRLGVGGIAGMLYLYDLSNGSFVDLKMPIYGIRILSPQSTKLLTYGRSNDQTEELVLYKIVDGTKEVVLKLENENYTFESIATSVPASNITWIDENTIEVAIYDTTGVEPSEPFTLIRTETLVLSEN